MQFVDEMMKVIKYIRKKMESIKVNVKNGCGRIVFKLKKLYNLIAKKVQIFAIRVVNVYRDITELMTFSILIILELYRIFVKFIFYLCCNPVSRMY